MGVAVKRSSPDGNLKLFDRAVVVVAVVSLVQFDYLSMIGLGFFMSALRVAAVLLSAVYLVVRRVKIDLYLVIWLALVAWLLCVTALLGEDIGGALSLGMRILLPALLFMAFRSDYKFVLQVVYVVLGLLVVANFVSILAFPDGMYVTGTTNFAYENWLLGFKNKHIVFFLPLMLATFLLAEVDGFSLDKAIVLGVIIVSSALAQSSTTIVCMAFMILFAFAPFFRKRYRVFNARTYLVAGLILFLLVVVFRAQEWLSFIIVDLLGKDLTFSNRTLLWDVVFKAIPESPIVGFGYWSLDARHALYNSLSIMSAHNQILEFAFEGGLVMVALYLMVNALLTNRLHQFAQSRVVQFASALYLGMMVVLLTEVYEDALFYSLYFMIWLAPDFVKSARVACGGVSHE